MLCLGVSLNGLFCYVVLHFVLLCIVMSCFLLLCNACTYMEYNKLLLHIISYCARISLQVFAAVPGAHL